MVTPPSSSSQVTQEIPVTWDAFRRLPNNTRENIIQNIAKNRFTGASQIQTTDALGNLQQLLGNYRTENTFTTRCWHVVKGFFWIGDESREIQSLEKERDRLLGETLIASFQGIDTEKGFKKQMDDFFISGVGSGMDKQSVLDRALFHCVSADLDIGILKALLEKGANPNRFYPVDDKIKKYLDDLKNTSSVRMLLPNTITAATAFGIYVLSEKASGEGVSQLKKRSSGLTKGYVGEPRVSTAPRFIEKMQFVFSSSWLARHSLGAFKTIAPVTEFLTDQKKRDLGFT